MLYIYLLMIATKWWQHRRNIPPPKKVSYCIIYLIFIKIYFYYIWYTSSCTVHSNVSYCPIPSSKATTLTGWNDRIVNVIIQMVQTTIIHQVISISSYHISLINIFFILFSSLYFSDQKELLCHKKETSWNSYEKKWREDPQ